MRKFGTADGDDHDIKTEGNKYVAYMWFHVSDEEPAWSYSKKYTFASSLYEITLGAASVAASLSLLAATLLAF